MGNLEQCDVCKNYWTTSNLFVCEDKPEELICINCLEKQEHLKDSEAKQPQDVNNPS